MKTALPTDVRINDGVLHQELGDEVVIMNMANEAYFSLDPVGARFWSLLESGAAVPQIIESMLAEFAVERHVLENDLSTLLGQMEEHGLVTIG